MAFHPWKAFLFFVMAGLTGLHAAKAESPTSRSSRQEAILTRPMPWLDWFAMKRQGCHFLCQEIPHESEVLSRFGEPSARLLTKPTLRVLAWNVYKGRKDLYFQDFAKMSKGLDLIMLSEGTDGHLVKPALDRLTDFGWAMGTSFFMKEEVRTGLITGSYAVPTGVAYTRTQDLEPFVKSPKVILITKYYHQPTEQEILVLNIHGINWVSTEAFTRQIQSVEPYLREHRGPILFAGDFNVRVPERLTILLEILGRYGMVRMPWKNPNEGKQLDDAFMRGFQVRQALMVNQVIDRSSDHPALFMELTPVRALKKRPARRW